MTRKEYELILKVLEKIKNPDSWTTEAKYLIKRDIERYNKMAKDNRRGFDLGYEIP